MKFIRTIIAFFSVYVFLGVVLVFLALSYWLSSFISDSPANEVAQVRVGALETTSAPFTFDRNSATNALVTTVTRGVDSSEFTGHTVLAARSLVIIGTFEKVTLSEQLVPMGFKTLYRIKKATDANGRVLYERKDTFLDAILKAVGGAFLTWSEVHVPFVAYDKPITYTVTATEEELFIAKEYEN